MITTLAIIGTAGRKDDAPRLNREMWERMVSTASDAVDRLRSEGHPVTQLFSGGAAYADHVAVALYLQGKVPNLVLFLPEELVADGRFKENPSASHWSKNPGGVTNHYHRQFSARCGLSSFQDLALAKAKGAVFFVGGGFHERNKLVAQAEGLLAMTFGSGAQLKDGGTAHTVGCYLERCRKEGKTPVAWHYNLTDGVLYPRADLGSEYEPPLKDVRVEF